ncbi:hypothetical protein HZA85_02775 [Candidatus Uhrbacteria bacterium]|nr:hypothetical protein [Candidatus Uhrbacteria bacterium]
MKDQDITQLMRTLKDNPEFNRSFDAKSSWKLVSTRCGFENETKQDRYSVRDHIEFYVWSFSHAMIRPLSASVAVFLLMLAGWVGASNASFNALPGDQAYPLKLQLERTQLALAFDPVQKAKLQVDFASRRLEEMVEVSAHSYESNPAAVRLAVQQFKKEVQSIHADLKEVSSRPSQTELAKEVGRKTKNYQSTVADSSTGLPQDVKDEVSEVQSLLEQTQDEAVEVIITAHEANDDAATAYELQKAFEKDLASVTALQLSASQRAQVDQAVTLQKEGAYRRAFQILKEVKASISP